MAQGRYRSFIIGGIIGAGIALLFAPRSGKETRAYLTEKAEEKWGEGASFYSQGYERIKTEAANVQRTVAQTNDELRVKIENARTAIAEQIAKNAQSARDAINAQIPIDDKIDQKVDVIKGQIDSAAEKIKSVAASFASRDASYADETVVGGENATEVARADDEARLADQTNAQ